MKDHELGDSMAFTIYPLGEENRKLARKLAALTTLNKSLEAQMAEYVKKRFIYDEAKTSLESERKANDILTNELGNLREAVQKALELARYGAIESLIEALEATK